MHIHCMCLIRGMYIDKRHVHCTVGMYIVCRRVHCMCLIRGMYIDKRHVHCTVGMYIVRA